MRFESDCCTISEIRVLNLTISNIARASSIYWDRKSSSGVWFWKLSAWNSFVFIVGWFLAGFDYWEWNCWTFFDNLSAKHPEQLLKVDKNWPNLHFFLTARRTQISTRARPSTVKSDLHPSRRQSSFIRENLNSEPLNSRKSKTILANLHKSLIELRPNISFRSRKVTGDEARVRIFQLSYKGCIFFL